MRISILDSIFPVGHKQLNNKLVSLFPKINMDILVANNKNFFDEEVLSNAVFKDFNLIGHHKKYYLNIIFQIFNYINIWLRTLDRKDDIKFFLTFENVSFAFARILFFNSKNVLFHHNNTDLLSIKYVLFFFKTYMNSVHHVVFADFIKNRLLEIGVRENRIFVLTHPLPNNKITFKEDEIKNLFVGLGYASDHKLFNEIIEFENKFGILKKNKIKLVLRSSYLDYEGENITFFNEHLSEEGYTNLMCSASGVLILYPVDYKYRYSGGILDALRCNKMVIGAEIPIVLHFKKLYPDLCYSFNSIEDFFSVIVKAKSAKHNSFSFNEFWKKHDDLKVRQDLENILLSV